MPAGRRAGRVGQQPGPTTPSATDKVSITGWALSMSNVATGANQTIQITIDSWSSPAQRQHLIATFLEKKQDGLLRELEKQPELGGSTFPATGARPEQHHASWHGHPLRHELPGEDGGRRIVIITPRVIGFREATNRPRTFDYPFTLFEMRFDNAGKGDGRMAYATQIVFDKTKNTDRDRELHERAGAAQQPGADGQEVDTGCPAPPAGEHDDAPCRDPGADASRSSPASRRRCGRGVRRTAPTPRLPGRRRRSTARCSTTATASPARSSCWTVAG